MSAAFEEHGSLAGPPTDLAVSEVSATALLLQWKAPAHLGGSGFEVSGYQILVQYGGNGGFSVHIQDTGSAQPKSVVEELPPDTWHKFKVRTITAAGIGAFSKASRPVLTERAPVLLRELRAAEALLSTLQSRLQRRQVELLTLARSGTMALRATASSAPDGDGSAASTAHDTEARAAAPAESTDARDANEVGPPPSRVTASQARKAVRRRKRHEQQVEQLEEQIASQTIKVATLQANQAGTDAARRAALVEVAGFLGPYG